jgi:predicted RNase H-like HicB family nuclease
LQRERFWHAFQGARWLGVVTWGIAALNPRLMSIVLSGQGGAGCGMCLRERARPVIERWFLDVFPDSKESAVRLAPADFPSGRAGKEGIRRIDRKDARFYRRQMRTLTAIIYPGETSRWMVAYNPETGTTTQGKTVEQALANLKEATALYLAEVDLPERRGALLTTFEVENA